MLLHERWFLAAATGWPRGQGVRLAWRHTVVHIKVVDEHLHQQHGTQLHDGGRTTSGWICMPPMRMLCKSHAGGVPMVAWPSTHPDKQEHPAHGKRVVVLGRAAVRSAC